MGFKEFWNRLTSGDKLERVEEELEADSSKQPEQVEDYQGNEGRRSPARALSGLRCPTTASAAP